MLTITEQIPNFDTYEEYLGYRSETALFFDIETTGLSASTAIVFLIGTVKKCDGGWQLTQWIAQHPEDEPELLRAFFDAAADCDTLIHFNGTTFDLPFIKERAKRIRSVLPEGYPLPRDPLTGNSLDLYQRFRPLKDVLGLPRMNQTTLEEFLGWPREDRLNGRQMISLFQKYTASQEPRLLDLLLLHNHDDLLGMTDLLRLNAYSMLFGGQFASVRASILQTERDGADPSGPRACDSSGDSEDPNESYPLLKLQLTLNAALPRELTRSVSCNFLSDRTGHRGPSEAVTSVPDTLPCPDSVLRCTLTASGTQAVLSIPGFRGELRHFFPNYRDYYYLPMEDQAIHKSVGSFVDKEYRVPARPENCYVKKSGAFFPQPEECFSPAFKSSYESKELFFACPETGSALFSMPGQKPESAFSFPGETLAAYAASLLRMFMRPV